MLKVTIEKDKIVGDDGCRFKLSDYNPHEVVVEFGIHEGTRLPLQPSGVFQIYEGWYFTKRGSEVADTRCIVQLRINDQLVAQTSLISLIVPRRPATETVLETVLYERGRFPAGLLVSIRDDVEIRTTHGPFFQLHAHLYGRRNQVIT
jgi:hypothetical protein